MSSPFLGEIVMFAGNFAPRGWAFCDGQLLVISQNSALFSILGTTYGGDGRTTFALPDLRDRLPMHAGSGPGLTTRRLGEKGGQENVVLTTNQIPPHNHTAVATTEGVNDRGNQETPGGNVWAKKSRDDDYSDLAPDAPMNAAAVTVAIENTGGGGSHNNLPPFQAVNFIIALQGVFPSRN